MKIDGFSNYNQNKYNSSFKAVPIANVLPKNCDANEALKLYKLTKNDIPFLQKMARKLDLKKIYPEIKNHKDIVEWKSIILDAINNLRYSTNGVLAVKGKKPCGIATYTTTESGKTFYLENIATWRVKKGQRTALAGKALMKRIFEDAKNTQMTRLFGIPSYINPKGKECRQFYREIGFNFTDSGIFEIRNLENIDKKSQNLSTLFDYIEINTNKDVNLKKNLNLNFTPSFLDKALEKLNF